MKAYILTLANDEEGAAAIVFANTPNPDETTDEEFFEWFKNNG